MGPLPLVALAPRTERDSWQELSKQLMDEYRCLQDRRERSAECRGAEDLAANSELRLHEQCVETMHTQGNTLTHLVLLKLSCWMEKGCGSQLETNASQPLRKGSVLRRTEGYIFLGHEAFSPIAGQP